MIPFTRTGYDKLLAERARLQQKRAETGIRVQTAREMGDLSENGAYKYGRMELGDIGRQLRQLSFLLKNAVVTPAQKNGSVGFGSVVTVTAPTGTKTFTMVSEYESDPLENRLSMTGPIGQALMGKKVGDKVSVVVPAGKVTYEINSLS